jgi:undecaprenyl-diphosphatase
MNWWQAIVLGLVEGLTEYLPVSSTGHLLLTQRLLGITQTDAANAYAIAIQAGAIVAVLGLYRQRVARMIRGVFGRDATGLRLALGLIVAFIPAAVIGLLFDKRIEAVLFGLEPVAAAWIIGGVVILDLVRRGRLRPGLGGKRLEELTLGPALVIGLFQCLALWPGTSRSLVTILAGALVGLSLPAAVEFSFLLGLVTLGAATVYKSVTLGAVMVHSYGLAPLLIGFAAAWISAVIAVRWMVAWLQHHSMAVFGWWRAGAGALTLAFLFILNS